jgi:NAD(P)-dependent dehydrogenase (short-subunit alcohol dehydrogenase family)
VAETASQCGSSASSQRFDVTDEANWEEAIRRVLEQHGRLNVLVNSAGVSAASPLTETSFTEWRRVLAVNLDGAFLATRHALRAMRTTGGSIVHVSSASGIKAPPGAAAYSTSKAALCMLAKAAAKECRDQKLPVRINTVCPGGVKTPLWSTMPFFRALIQKTGSEEAAFAAMTAGTGGQFAEPTDVVAAILFLASDEARFVTGIDLLVDDGYVL